MRLSNQVEKVSELLQKLVRIKASDDNGLSNCVICGVSGHWKEMNGAHYVDRGRWATRLMEENIFNSCPRCNWLMMTKHPSANDKARQYMVDTYGEVGVREIEDKSREVKKWDRWELEEMRKDIMDQIKELEKHVL